MTPHLKALGQLVNMDMLKIRFSGFLIREIRKTEIHSFVARRATTRESILHFTKGTKNFYSHHYNPPQMGYRWVRGDPRITPVWALFRISGFRIGKSGKTGNPEKCHVTYQIKALFKLVDMDHTKIRISGFCIRKMEKMGKRSFHIILLR